MDLKYQTGWDTVGHCEGEGSSITNYTVITVISWECSRQTKTFDHPHITPFPHLVWTFLEQENLSLPIFFFKSQNKNKIQYMLVAGN